MDDNDPKQKASDKDKKKQRTETITAATLTDDTTPKDIKGRSRARSIWGRKKSAA